MNKEYKEMVIRALFGMMDGNANSLEGYLRKAFKDRFNIDVDIIGETIKNKLTEEIPSSWIGAIKMTLIIDGESFSIIRDFEEEYINDIKHPDYETDDWFYESDKAHSHKTYLSLMSEL